MFFSERFAEISRNALRLYAFMVRAQSKIPYANYTTAWGATAWLNSCIEGLRCFDSFCEAVTPRPGIEKSPGM